MIGNPDNRRVTGFVAAVRDEEAGSVVIVPWIEVARNPRWWEGHDEAPTLVRIESAGENAEVQRALLDLGGMPEAPEFPFGAFVPPVPVHRGFLALLGRIEAALQARPAWTSLAEPAGIRQVFDKAVFHRHCQALGVAVPAALEATDRSTLERRMAEAGWAAAFVKIRTGSSAVGVGLFRLRPQPSFLTTVHMTDAGWFNSLRLRRYHAPADLDRVIGGLMAHGVHIERAIDKARIDGANLDCRILMIDRQPRFVVVRQNRHPITNLHLGGWRGRLGEMRSRCAPEVWEAALADAERLATHYGGLHLGLDVAFTRGFRSHVVLEANAFGDLLPRLTHEGRNVYATEVAAVPAWWSKRSGTQSSGSSSSHSPNSSSIS
ncbi:MAG: STM4014 family protein [Myxococcota bacterium]